MTVRRPAGWNSRDCVYSASTYAERSLPDDMKLSIVARNMAVTPAITKRIEKKTETMGKYLLPDTEMQIKMRKEKDDRRVVEITVPMGKNVILRSESSADDNLFLAIDKALAKMERQIRKHRTKLGKNLREEAFTEVPEYIEEDLEQEEELKVVRRKTYPVRPMSLEDAIIEMELLGHSFFVFVDVDTERTNVLYLRKGGGLGLLEPEA
ncbi:MAG: ribosome-associated translation inhibitor RaiA [Clostridiales bacterium]|nr:ribosome-associated translation inhibitor RaiA [Clostridiales bacterium]